RSHPLLPRHGRPRTGRAVVAAVVAGRPSRRRQGGPVTSEPAGRYRFRPRERGGALAGWRAGQILTIAVGLVFGVLVLRWQPNVAGVAAALGILVLYGALATVPVSGRTGDEGG